MRSRVSATAVCKRTCLTLVSCLLCLWLLEPARAAFPVRLLVVSAPGVSPRQRDPVISRLGQIGDVIAPREYAAAAKDEGLAPSSVEALERVAPNLHARLIIVLSTQRRGLNLSFRDGRSGTVLHEMIVALQRKTVPARALYQIEQIARNLLATGEGAAPIAASAQLDPTPSAAPTLPPQTEAPSLPDMEPIPQRFVATELPRAGVDFARPEPAHEADRSLPATPRVDDAPARMAAAVTLGPGIGSRSVRTPTASGDRSLATGFFPALDLGLGAEFSLSPQAAIDVTVHYQTSIGLHASETELGTGVEKRTSLRSHHLDVGVSPAYRFTASPAGVLLGVFAGWGFRGLRSIVDISIPAYTLHGPVFRPEIRIPIAGNALVLRVAPELMLIVEVSGELRELGNTAASGLSLGGEASLDIRLVALIHLTLAYRESRARLATAWGDALTDDERFGTVSLVLNY
jgi:hypothetical protein